MYRITRSGFSFLVMGFTGKNAAGWKEKYINAFDMMEKALLQKENLQWQQTRSEGKVIRYETTDSLKEFINFAKQQGSKHADKYFVLFTKLVYGSLFSNYSWKTPLPEGFRDKLANSDLMQIGYMENILKKTVETEMGRGTHYKAVWKIVKSKLESIASIAGRTEVSTLPSADAVQTT